jgi:hypothetical protein
LLDNWLRGFNHHLYGLWRSDFCDWRWLNYDLFGRWNLHGWWLHDLLFLKLLTFLAVLYEQREDRIRHLGALTLVESLHELVDAIYRFNQARLAVIFGINVLQSNEMYLFILDGPSVQCGDFVNQHLCIGQQGFILSVRNLYLLPSVSFISRPWGF